MNVVVAARRRSDRPPGNPFATRFTRPGAVPPLDRDGRPLDIATLVGRLQSLGSAAVVGPHGHGKTTLLVALAEALAAAGQAVRLVRARGWADLPATLAAIGGPPAGTWICVAGWESLGPGRWLLQRAARLLSRRLLVTSHGAAGLPVLHACETSGDLLAAIVARLPDRGDRIGTADVTAAFARHGGDLRASLFDLYDRYERTATAGVPACGH
jgi:hypothetical protein